MKSLILCFSVLLLLNSTLVSAQTVHMVTVDWSPFYGRDLPKQGFITEIARQALESRGHELKITFMPWKRAMLLAKKGEAHGLFGCWINDEIKPDYYFSKEIMGNGDGHFLAPLNSAWHDLVPEKLVGRRVGIVGGYPISDILNALFKSGKIIKNEVSRVNQLLDMINARNRIDLILENYQVAKFHFEKINTGQVFPLKIVGKDYVDSGLYICWTRKILGMKILRNEFDDAISEMRRNGKIKKIEDSFNLE
ncbi:MAG: transporter substrate-binding domain-containing protein [Bermanella sp.]